MLFLTGVITNIEGTHSSKNYDCVSYVLFYVCFYGLVLWTDLRKGLYMRRVLKCASAYDGV